MSGEEERVVAAVAVPSPLQGSGEVPHSSSSSPAFIRAATCKPNHKYVSWLGQLLVPRNQLN